MSLITSPRFSEDDHEFMAQAIELARKGLFTTTPNPRVGCVLVNQGQVVGSGWHYKSGDAHAEINALSDAGVKALGSTAYITLEPCSFKGKTGPCVEALQEAGVKRVIYAAQDPNPKVRGLGHEQLEKAGIAVSSGLMAKESTQLNRGFFKRMKTGLPFVTAKMAMSLDGRTAMQSGESKWITGSASRAEVQNLRAQSCALITGIGTVLQDDPALTVREEQWGHAVERQPDVIVIDAQLQIPLSCKLLNEISARQRKVIIACSGGADPGRVKALEKLGAKVHHFDAVNSRQNISIVKVLEYLGLCEYNEVLLESGARLFGQFVAQEQVDELQLFVAAKFLGSTAKPLLVLPLDAMSEAVALHLVEVQQYAADLKLRYSFSANNS